MGPEMVTGASGNRVTPSRSKVPINARGIAAHARTLEKKEKERNKSTIWDRVGSLKETLET